MSPIGLVFDRAVAVAACDDEILPLQSRIEDIADEGDLKDIYATDEGKIIIFDRFSREDAAALGIHSGMWLRLEEPGHRAHLAFHRSESFVVPLFGAG